MKINHMICPTCGHDFYVDASYAHCDACGTVFYATDSRTCRLGKADLIVKRIGTSCDETFKFTPLSCTSG